MSKSSPESIEPASPSPVIPHIRCQDNAEQLPKYHAALMRAASGELPPDDLEQIQAELETLLSTVALRYRVLKCELESNDSRRTKYLDRAPISPDKRRRGNTSSAVSSSTSSTIGGKPRQKFSANSPLNHPPTKISKIKNSSPAPSQHTDDSSDVSSSHNPKHIYHRNDTPNKFWLSIEPFTVPINQEDIRLLDVLLEEYSGILAPSIPDLGPHYTTQWGIVDEHNVVVVKEEQDNNNSSSNISSNIKGKKSTSQNATQNGQQQQQQQQPQNGDVMRVLRNSKKMGEGITGPFTQRLVSALMEENLINDNHHHHTTATTTSTENSNSSLENIPNNTNMVHTRSAANLLKNGIAAERRIRKELIEQGILEAKDVQPSSEREDVDEVLSEIQKVRSDLIAISESNTSQLTTLKEVALNELKRHEIKRKLDDVDHEIVEQNKRVQLAKQKGRSLSKSERDEILRLIEKQRKLSNELENLKLPGYSIPFLA
jgi:transcriptional adapter 3